jgi:hypothetical protein
MSSWANINVRRKRDLSKIPESLRPEITPRIARPEVIISESFQKVSDVSRNDNYGKTDSPEYISNSRQYNFKKVDTTLQPAAFELIYNDKSYVFVILRNLRSPRDNDLWISSYNSIRKFYKNKIVIIDDNSSINTVDGKLVNTEIIKSELNGAGEILPYYYFLKYKWADRMIFLHDSMFLNRAFRDNELEGQIRFHWYFKSNGFDNFRKIKNYISLLKDADDVQTFINTPENKWLGCFGAASICDFELIQDIENKYKLFSTISLNIKARKDRESFERLFGIILFTDGIINNDCSNFGDITQYPGAFESENNNIETATHILKQRGYDTAIVKVWRGR